MSFSLFPAFFDHPQKIAFADQEQDEYIELFLRRHWVTNISWVLTATLGFILPIVLLTQGWVLEFLVVWKVPNGVLASMIILWYLFVLAYTISRFLHWYFNIYIITNKHLVDVDFDNLLSRHKTEVRLDDVQSVRSRLKGVLGPLFNFGDVSIETAADKLHLDFAEVPKPDFVTERIQDLQEAEEGGDVS